MLGIRLPQSLERICRRPSAGVSLTRILPKKHTDQAYRRVTSPRLLCLGIAELRPGTHDDQVRHGHLMTNLSTIDIGKQIKGESLGQSAAIRSCIRSMC